MKCAIATQASSSRRAVGAALSQQGRRTRSELPHVHAYRFLQERIANKISKHYPQIFDIIIHDVVVAQNIDAFESNRANSDETGYPWKIRVRVSEAWSS